MIDQVHGKPGPSAAAAAAASNQEDRNSKKLIQPTPSRVEVEDQPADKGKKKKEGKFKRFLKIFQKACTNERDDEEDD